MLKQLALIGLFFFSIHVNAQETPKTITALLQPYVEKNQLAGAVALVANNEKILTLETVGSANIAAKTPITKDSIFWIASMTKPITAIGLMMLVEEGKVSLDEPAAKYLPELADLWVTVEKDKEHILLKRPKTAPTVRMLLNHTSGMPFVSELEKPTLDLVTLKDAVRSYAMTPLLFEPGTKPSYSNCGINTAGRIIEVVSGLTYEEFMRKRLFEPLGLKNTCFVLTAEQEKRLVTSYKPNAKKDNLEETTIWALTYPLTSQKRLPMPAGGLFSTAEEVAVICQMMLNGGEWKGTKFLSQAGVAAMTQPPADAKIPHNFGVGWAIGPNFFGHGGAFATQMVVDTKNKLVMVYMVQHSGFPGDGAKAFDAFKQMAIKLYAGK